MATKITVTKQPVTIKLSQPVAPNSAAASFDVLQVKKSLNRLGYYIPPKDIGITDIPDTGLFTAIKNFQKSLGLSATGIINPDDVTLTSINTELKKPQTGYYIWNTVGDDRVRGEHEAFEGTIRSWDNSPATRVKILIAGVGQSASILRKYPLLIRKQIEGNLFLIIHQQFLKLTLTLQLILMHHGMKTPL